MHELEHCHLLFLMQALLSELAENSGKVEQLKSTLRKLIAENPDSPEADTWRQQLQEIGTVRVWALHLQNLRNLL